MNIYLKKLVVLYFIVLYSILIVIIIPFMENHRNLVKIFYEKSVLSDFCRKGMDWNNDAIAVFRIANKLDIRLFIAEPQRLVKYLNEEELKFLEKNYDNFTVKAHIEVNKIILGFFDFEVIANQIVRKIYFSIKKIFFL
jgi:hypothetical protein